MSRSVLADTSFWIEAFDPRERHHAHASRLLETLYHHVILMPWPIMYEVLRTRTVKNTLMVQAFERVIKRPRVLKIDDSPYRSACLESTFRSSIEGLSISLVDMVVRAVLEDESHKVGRLLTFNAKDFTDVCHRRRVMIWPSIIS